MIDGLLMDEINEAAAQGKDTLAPVLTPIAALEKAIEENTFDCGAFSEDGQYVEWQRVIPSLEALGYTIVRC